MSLASTHSVPPLAVGGPFQRVLAACSLDLAGLGVVQRAARLPLAPGARLEVLYVSSPWPTGRGRVSAPEARRALDEALGAAGDAAREMGNAGVQVIARAAEGWPAREIVRAAWRARAELIVVGRPATRFDGSPRATIARVLRWAGLPVLVVRREPSGEYRRVLCAVDRAATAAGTVELASRLAPSRPLTLFHAYHAPFEEWLGSAPNLEAEAVERLEEIARELTAVARVDRTLVRRGERCLQIVRAAVAERADLVVVGTRGRAGLARALSASAAQWVLSCAPVDVAVARRQGLAFPGDWGE